MRFYVAIICTVFVLCFLSYIAGYDDGWYGRPSAAANLFWR